MCSYSRNSGKTRAVRTGPAREMVVGEVTEVSGGSSCRAVSYDEHLGFILNEVGSMCKYEDVGRLMCIHLSKTY